MRAAAITLSLMLSPAIGGCSMSYKLDSFLGKDKDASDQTASVSLVPISGPTQDRDLNYAKAAAAEVLARSEKNASLPWENPTTGARGTVTAIADAYTQDGFQCRDFLASYVRGSSESWLQGDGCRIHQGKWTVRSLRPLKRS